MQPKSGRKKPMSNTAELSGMPRSTIALWVHREEHLTGSRMAAYQNIAATVGTSADWIRRFYRGDAAVKEPGWALGCNIIENYKRVCERFERAEQAEAEQAANLKREMHEATARYSRMVEGPTQSRPASTRTEND